VDPPGWWRDPSPGTAELLYRKGSSEKCSTESVARQVAWDNALAEIRQGITDDTDFWPQIHLIGTDVAHSETQKDALGRWYAWVLVSYPRAQLEKSLARATNIAEKAQKRTAVFVCPLSFGAESKEQYPDIVDDYKKKGYGNAIWQTVEDLLYDQGFEIVTAPTSSATNLVQQMFGQSISPSGNSVKLPEKILLCNMNFVEIKTESLSLGKRALKSEYHAALHLSLFSTDGLHTNVPIPASGRGRHEDLLHATQEAAVMAVEKLTRRMQK